ncbi:MAG: peptidoglycan DD-metalloendopeptidase family protein [Gallionella sp.]
MKFGVALLFLIISALVSSCASSGKPAPIKEGIDGGSGAVVAEARRSGLHEKDWRPAVYVVQKGDTLYSIAFNFGFDYHELADLNHIEDPSLISIGQEIRLFPGQNSQANTTAPAEAKPIESLIKEQPKLVKFAYSPAAMAQIEKVQQQKFAPSSEVAEVVATQPNPESKPDVEPAANGDAANQDEPSLAWIMPAQGKVIGGFSEIANRKGIDIAGTLGEPIVASEAGKVVYSGSGLRGYGKLIIIKHNKIYLSAYAHNDKVMVKEGDSVTRGQKIAAMGKTDSDKVKLHFEVRRFGRPVDPAKYLPPDKS